MEAEDDKLRRQARKAFSAQVREAAQQAHRNDPRVRAQRESQRLEASLAADRRAEEQELEQRQMEEERLAKREAARASDEARWAEMSPAFSAQSSPMLIGDPGTFADPFFCRACGKGFKSHGAWLDHAATKRHRQNARRWQDAGHGSPCVQMSDSSPSILQRPSPSILQRSSPSMLRRPSDAGSTDAHSFLLLPAPAVPLPEESVGDFSPVDSVQQDGTLIESPAMVLRLSIHEDSTPPLRRRSSSIDESLLCSQAAQAPMVKLPRMLELVAAIPSHVWTRALSLLFSGRECARAALALLSCRLLREGALSEPSMWNDL